VQNAKALDIFVLMFLSGILTLANPSLVNVKRLKREKSDDNNCLSYLI